MRDSEHQVRHAEPEQMIRELGILLHAATGKIRAAILQLIGIIVAQEADLPLTNEDRSRMKDLLDGLYGGKPEARREIGILRSMLQKIFALEVQPQD